MGYKVNLKKISKKECIDLLAQSQALVISLEEENKSLKALAQSQEAQIKDKEDIIRMLQCRLRHQKKSKFKYSNNVVENRQLEDNNKNEQYKSQRCRFFRTAKN